MILSETLFFDFFELPKEGLTSFSDIPMAVITEMRSVFSNDPVSPISLFGKKKLFKIEYRILCDIVAKSISARRGSFDSYTIDRLEVMTAITKGIAVNWSDILFKTLMTMVTQSTKQHLGFAVQLGEFLINCGVNLKADANLHPHRTLNNTTNRSYIERSLRADIEESVQHSSETAPEGKKPSKPSESAFSSSH